MNAPVHANPTLRHSYFEATARSRVAAVLDAGSFREFLPPETATPSPHLAVLDIPGAFDDGVIVGSATLGGKPVLVIAQEGQFMGGAVGEIHGAKIVGLLAYIGLGMLALKPGRPLALRGGAFVAALATFSWIVSVALSKNPLGWLAGL